MPPRRRSSPPADPRRRGSTCARPSTLRPLPCLKQCATRSTSSPAMHCPVARTVTPDLTRLGKMNDVFLSIAGPRHILLPFSQRRSHGMYAGYDALLRLIDFL